MSTPKENPITIRKAGLRERIQAYATDKGLKFNVAAVALIEQSLPKVRGQAAKPTPPKAKAKKTLAEVERALGVAPAALPAPTLSVQPLDTSSVPFNPARAPMQKTPKGKGRWGL